MSDLLTADGFRVFAEIPDAVAGTVRVEEFASAEEGGPCVWVGSLGGTRGLHLTTVAPAVLTREGARQAIAALEAFLAAYPEDDNG